MSSMGIEALGLPQLPGTTTVGVAGGAPGAGSALAAGASAAVEGADRLDATGGPTGPSGPDFGRLLVDSLDRLEAMGDKAADLSVQAATGDLGAIHDYTIAATEAQVATQLTVAVRNKAVDAFNEIMRMSV